MKYYAVFFTLSPNMEAARDVLASLAGEIGFESFEETKNGLNGYIQTAFFNQDTLNEMLQEFPFPDIQVTYQKELVEEQDWNATWEEEGFEPIIVNDQCIIYDAKHQKHSPTIENVRISVGIEAVQAFGTGTHDTTQLIVSELLRQDCRGKRIIDCGCGTGILSIVAAKCGASEVVAYDIDDWSVNNTIHNAKLNGVENIDVLLGDAQVLSHIEGLFDIVLANINRNILLEDLPTFKSILHEHGIIILSGFYENDSAVLTEKAKQLGLKLISQKEKNQWCMIVLGATTEN